uniref:Peptidase S1 domain-containing protein n=1 Tax=Aureoumbra lagunensis TaxID=44058 RepID=A0A7S3JWA1_9STRA
MQKALCIVMCVWELGVLSAKIRHDKYSVQMPHTKRIINGELATLGQYPWFAAIIENADGSEVDYFENHFCGGALIATEWILTAEHCLSSIRNENLSVLIGTTSLSVWYQQSFEYQNLQYKAEWRDVVEVFIHSSSDLALLKIAQPSNLPQLRYTSVSPKIDTMAQLMGFGDINMADNILDHPDDLYYINVPIVSDEVCEERLNTFGYTMYADREEICAGYEDAGFAPCQGDSGGPLIVQSELDGEWEVVGVVSWGPGCGGPGTVDVFTDVTQLTEYINTVINSIDGLAYVDGVACSSSFDGIISENNNIYTAQECWQACRNNYGVDTIVAAYFDSTNAQDFSCACYDSCLCTEESNSKSSVLVYPVGETFNSCNDMTVFLNYWCDSSLDDFVGFYDSTSDCWDACFNEYDNSLVAIDFHPSQDGRCFCQNACNCLHEFRGSNIMIQGLDEFPTVCGDFTPIDDVTDDEVFSLNDNLRLVDESVWCSSDLNSNPSPNAAVETIQMCWDLCVYIFDNIVAIDWHPGGYCYCQNSCDCLLSFVSAKLVVASDFQLPATCGDSLTTNVPTSKPTPLCSDSASWYKNGEPSKDCNWVNEFAPNRCGVKNKDATPAFEACLVACDTCPGSCNSQDSTTWYRAGDPSRGCDWVADSYPARCTRSNDDGVYGFESSACPYACRVCTYCDNDDSWALNNDEPEKNCNWVAEASQSRCTKSGIDLNGNITYAYQSCVDACRVCPNYGDCSDDDGWVKNNEDDDSRNCSWVASFPESRCLVKGTDSTDSDTYAFESCRVACSTC